ncbi:MAG: EVE domain-containing protein [Bdellovibrio sp.]|nr:MAG: EVE domain-containing protein [Bdellovibrio sp.]
MRSQKRYWLMKSEPDVYSIDDLKRDKVTFWDGVRNYQARNFMRDQMQEGDEVLFYHSNAKPPGVVGLAKIVKVGIPDPTAFDPQSEYFDPKSSPENPRWYGVEVQFLEKWKAPVTLEEIKKHPQLKNMLVAQKGQRLSVQPVEASHFRTLKALGRRKVL